ncbi:MAG: copper-binding protein [Phycisphaerales bacterium]|jgi:hypothetical protein|nr:copper-binding protein [Phycisphaerales bacterium]
MNHTRTLILASLALSSTLFLSACSESTTPTSSEAPSNSHDDHAGHDHAGHDHDAPDPNAAPDIYENILGEITMIPIENDPTTELKIRHQQIPNFKTKDGTININSKGIAGMASMTMPFPLAQDLPFNDFAIGDKVSFDFQVNWSGTGPAWEVTRIEKIDQSIEIDYTNKISEMIDDAKDMLDDHMDDHGHDHDHD